MRKRRKRRKKIKTKAGLTIRGKIAIFFVLFFIVLTTVVTLLLTLPQFSLKKININNLVKIEEKEILKKADLMLDKNIFLQKYFKVEKDIKTIKAVKNVDIKFNLPDGIDIFIEEREETYQIKSDKKYYIIDDQGYLIKTVEKKNNMPEIIGVKADFENDIRLKADELARLEDINKIFNTAKVLNIDGLITQITLEKIGFNINFASNKKKAHFENINNLMNSMQFVREILCSDEETNKAGDIYATEEGARFKSK